MEVEGGLAIGELAEGRYGAVQRSEATSTSSSSLPTASPPTVSPSTTSAPPPTTARPSSAPTSRSCPRPATSASTTSQRHPSSPPAPSPNSPYKFPSHLQPAFDATVSLRGPVASLVRSLSSGSRRVVVVHDYLMASVVQDAASVPNAEIYVFNTVSALTLCWYLWESTGMAPPPEVELDIAELISSKGFPSFLDSITDEFLKFVASQNEFQKFSSGSIYNTCRVIEGHYVDLYASATANDTATKYWAIGPFNPIKVPEKSSRRSAHVCMEWLDKQAPSSVIYVSFGTATVLSDEQIRAVKALMTSEEGEEMRKRAAELGAAVRGSMDEGGVSRAELDSFISHISR
ncbi:hypothetical protein NL676_016929 [Syzygium grande]|nr:hypothetical protein NL676_016929 [Syzygium grande]